MGSDPPKELTISYTDPTALFARCHKLRDGLGLTEPAAVLVGRRVASVPPTEQYLATLAGCIISAGGATLADLAHALDVSIPAVREGISVLDDRLARVGVRVADDGVRVRVAPLGFAQEAVTAVTQLEAAPRLTEEQTTVLCVVGYAGAITRRRLEELRGEDCESLLRRMVSRGLLEATRDDGTEHAPNLYRVTAVALGAIGYPTVEAFQHALAGQLTPEELAKARLVG